MNQGYIKLHRKILEKGYYKKSQYIHLWVHLLLIANHKSNEFMWNNEIIIIKEGQLITGRKQLSEDTGISESTIERILKLLENEHQIEQQKTTKYRVITILNWSKHQKVDIKRNNRRTTDGQQTDTNNNDKNDNNDNIYNIVDSFNKLIIIPEQHKTLLLEEKQRFLDYWTEKSSGGSKERWQKEKVFDIKRRWARWLKNVSDRLAKQGFFQEKKQDGREVSRGGGASSVGELLDKYKK